MSGVVRARGDLVDEDVARLRHEYLDRKNAHQAELFGNMTRNGLRSHRRLRTDSSRCNRRLEDMVHVLVFYGRIGCPGAVSRTYDNNRDLAGKIDKAFEDPDLATHPPPSLFGSDFWS